MPWGRPRRPDPDDDQALLEATFAVLRDPPWRLLASMHALLIASFLHRMFVARNVRVMREADLSEALEDEFFAVREQLGPEAHPKGAQEHPKDWAAPDKGWLRKFCKPGTDEAQFDLTPAAEKAIAWLLSLTGRPFVGTESRLLTLFALLEQISTGTEADPIKKIVARMERSGIRDPHHAPNCPWSTPTAQLGGTMPCRM